ncbi:MAG: peptide ABC transporter substrate-binding protein [Chloroflexi bacterium]|nr:peptide ABC transporter substrate-binding protein [Chloroflexota bacterium]
MKKWLALLSLVLWLVACDVTIAPAPTAVPATPEPAATTTPTPIPPTPTPKPVPQVLRLQISQEPSTTDPQQASATDEMEFVRLVFSNLLTYDAQGNLVPDMAADMPVASADGLTYTVKLKPGLLYSDGQPLTARNFEYGWKRQLDPALAADNAFTGYVMVGAEAYASANPKKASKEELQKLRDAVGVKALDDQTLQFRLTARAPYFMAVLAGAAGLPARQDLVEKFGDKWIEPATYIGNGPYLLAEWRRGARIVFTANPRYTRGKPPVERIEITVSDGSAALIGYQNGELDAIRVAGNELAQSLVDAKLKPQLVSRTGGCTFYIGFNTTKPPFDKVAVRRAFAQALDKALYVKDVEKGAGAPANEFVPPGLPGGYADLAVLKFDAAAAKKELAQAGLAPDKLGDVRYGYVASPRNQARADWLQGQLKANLGVAVKADPLDAQTYRNNASKPETLPGLFLYGWCQDYADPQDWYQIFDSRSTAPFRTGWKNDKYDQLVREADRELDPKKRDGLYKQAAQILTDNVPVIFLYHTADNWLVQPHVSGAKQTPLDAFFASTSLMGWKILPH